MKTTYSLYENNLTLFYLLLQKLFIHRHLYDKLLHYKYSTKLFIQTWS